MKKSDYYFALSFIFIFVWLEFGAATLNIFCMDSYAYEEKNKVIFEKIPVIKNEDEPMDDSVDVIAEYMDHYIFLPVVDNMEWKTKEERREKNDKKILGEISMDETEMLYRLVTREAGNQEFDGMRLIVDVVLNRVNDPRFPNTIKSVIEAKGQFDGAKSLNKITPYEECKRAVDMELQCNLDGTRIDYESIYFGRSPHTKQNYKYGDHYFSH